MDKPIDIIDLQNAIHRHMVKKQLQPFDRAGMLWLTDGTQVGVSRRKKEEVIRELKG